jgi:integrase
LSDVPTISTILATLVTGVSRRSSLPACDENVSFLPVFSFSSLLEVIIEKNQSTFKISVLNSTESVYIRKQRVTAKGFSDTQKEPISTKKPNYKVLHIASEIDYPKVRTFLESVARGSKNSKRSYRIGLKHLQCFLSSNSIIPYINYNNLDTILLALQSNTISVYELLDNFVSYLVNMPRQPPIAPTSIDLYIYAVRSYLQYHDIDINPSKFRRRVKLPKVHREDERPIDASDIRNILLACNNRRLKAYILVLASGGMRAIEALAIRYRDVDFSISPTRVHLRKEFTKTKTTRDIYISDEATTYLKQWLGWKYREERILKTGKRTTTTPMPDELVFSPFIGSNPESMYQKLVQEFHKQLEVLGLNARKENSMRGIITFHSFRRFVKSVISDSVNQDYSEWFLGHRKSPYYVKKEHELREIYRARCMHHLTFLDYDAALQSGGRTAEMKLQEKEREIEQLRELESMSMDAIRQLSERLMQLEARFDKKQHLINNQRL